MSADRIAIIEHTNRPEVLTRPWVVALLATVCGVVFDVLAWGRPAGPGLSIALLTVIASIWQAVGERRPRLPLVVSVFFALVPSVRSSISLVVLAVAMVLTLLAVHAYLVGGVALSRWTLGTYARAGFDLIPALSEPAVLLRDDLDVRSSLRRVPRLLPIVRGLAIGGIVVVLFGLLFSSADPIFADLIDNVFGLDISSDRVVRFVLVVSLFGWLTASVARRTARPTPPASLLSSTADGRIEAVTVLSGVNLLFAAFVWIQFSYLFGGDVAVLEFGYATYARRGFFELVVVASLVMALVLMTDWLVQRDPRSRVIDMLHAVLVVQTFVVMASAIIRMQAYTDAFGLSRLRLFTSVFMLWVGLLLVWAPVTVLTGRRDRFAMGAFVSGLVTAVLLTVINPDAVIASVNIDRAVAGAELDVEYLVALGPDAIPAAAGGLDRLPEPVRSELVLGLGRFGLELENHMVTDGWRSWSWSDLVATRVLSSR